MSETKVTDIVKNDEINEEAPKDVKVRKRSQDDCEDMAPAKKMKKAAESGEVSSEVAPSTKEDDASSPLGGVDAISEAVRRAKEMAAKLSGAIGIKGPSAAGGATMSGAAKVRRKVYVPVEEQPDINWSGLLIGPRGETQKKLEADSGCRVLIRGRGVPRKAGAPPQADDDDKMHVLLVGDTDAQVTAAEDMVKEILFNRETASNLKRKQLSNLGAINGTATNANNVPLGTGHASSAPYGAPGAVSNGNDTGTTEIYIADRMIGVVIGRGGENIRSIQDRSGANVQVKKRQEMPPGSTDRLITIHGPAAARDLAKNLIHEMISQSEHQRQIDNAPPGASESVRYKIRDDKVGLVIGKRGITVRGIQDATGAHLQIPPHPDHDDPVHRTAIITGSKACCDAAIAQIEQIISQTDAGRGLMGPSLQVEIPDNKVGLVIGRRGATVNDIQERTGTHIQIPSQPDVGKVPPVRTCTISGGTPDAQNAARAEIMGLVSGEIRARGPPPAYGRGDGGGYYGHQSYGSYGGGGGYYDQRRGGYAPPQQHYGSYGGGGGGGGYYDQRYGGDRGYAPAPYHQQHYSAPPPPGTSSAPPPPPAHPSSAAPAAPSSADYSEDQRKAAWEAYYAQQQYYGQQGTSSAYAPAAADSVATKTAPPPPPGGSA